MDGIGMVWLCCAVVPTLCFIRCQVRCVAASVTGIKDSEVLLHIVHERGVTSFLGRLRKNEADERESLNEKKSKKDE